jgi:uncharacterized membrane protein YebE (DUF533 family)
MFDVRSLLEELLREDARSERQTPILVDKDRAHIPATTPVEPQSAPAPAAHLPASVELRPSDLRAASGERRPLGAAAPALAQTPHPGGDRPAAEVRSLEAELRRLLASAGLAPEAAQGAAAGGGLGDLLGKLDVEARHGDASLLSALEQVLSQAAGGVREASNRLDEATGASKYSGHALEQITGKSPAQIIAELKALLAENQVAAGAALGGLGALILGTPAGRALAATAAKLGGLALIGGLAYKAYRDYQESRPILQDPASPGPHLKLAAAPAGSGFEPGAFSNDGARLLIRTMIAAASADGRIDRSERQRILGNLRAARTSPEAQRFLMQEVQRPASASDLACEVCSPEQATQVYTAARIAVDLDSEEEHAFLNALAHELGIDSRLAAHIDAATRGASA